ncbi:hypothetical protein K492DRAFT_178158 [Lichtheimia hyalospora FSU 10163]|nr:hypothetical protein K492DRAFT_178158 [Lichtheimia hyalospora FSU 10163]
MKASIHVDYLSHDWSPTDVIRAHIQTRKQLRSTVEKLRSDPSNRAVRLEHQRLIRFQNALWRQMSRTCTCRLGRDNALIDPSTVNWQKESDITWLYGPLYTSENEPQQTFPCPTSSSSSSTSTPKYHPPHGLKPALKKQNTALYLRRGVDERIPSFSSISSTSSSLFQSSLPPTPPSVSQSTGVRFSPESIKVQYFEPESPVQESLEYEHSDGMVPNGWNPYWPIYDEQDDCRSRYYYYYADSNYDDQEDDDALWESMVSVVGHMKSFFSSWLPPRLWKSPTSSHTKRQNASLDLMVTLMSVTKSVASLVATWLMYQGMLRLVRRPSSIRQAPGKRENAITWQTFAS